MHTEALWVALTPWCVFIGAVIGFYFATEHVSDDSAPVVYRGDAENEPWGHPYTEKKYRFPGDSVQRTDRVIERDTTQFACVGDRD